MIDRARLWPWGIGAVLVLTVVGNAAVYQAANDANAAAVEPDYYRKAVEWDSTLAQEERNHQLGWRAEIDPDPMDSSGASTIAVTLQDAAGSPIAAANLDLIAIHNAAAATPSHDSTRTDDAGRARIRLPLRHRGLWEFRLTATRGATRFTAVLHRDVGELPAP
jgi:hypothetical protein